MISRISGLLLVASISADVAIPDDVEFLNQEGDSPTIQGQIYAADPLKTVLQKDDGSFELVPTALITKRALSEPPAFVSPQQMLERLVEQFSSDLFRGAVSGHFVVGVVLQAPVAKKNEPRLQRALERAVGYMTRVEESFDKFITSLGIEVHEPELPLVLLIFESDSEFETFSADRFGRSRMTAEDVKGFYSNITNVLYVRMSECASFDTPIHEAIHQLCFNKGIFQRLAPVPAWLAEGMACSFEASGTRVRSNPEQLNSEFASVLVDRFEGPGGARWNQTVNPFWTMLVRNDDHFRGKDSWGEAYISSWALHWILVKEYNDQYASYLKDVMQLEPLQDVDDVERLKQFENAFSSSADVLWAAFRKNFDPLARRSPSVRRELGRVGISRRESHLASVSMFAARDSTRLIANGEIRNISPFRDMAYYVALRTDGGRMLHWFLPSVRMGKSVKLRRQQSPGAGKTFSVHVRSAPAASETAAAWASGNLPAIQDLER